MILLFILVWGMFAGWIAHLLLARNQPINWAELLVVGLAGSFVGGLLISLLSGDGLALRPSGIIGSILGARCCCWRPGEPSGQPRAAGRDSSAASSRSAEAVSAYLDGFLRPARNSNPQPPDPSAGALRRSGRLQTDLACLR